MTRHIVPNQLTLFAYEKGYFGKDRRSFRRRETTMGGVGSGGWNKKYHGTIDDTLRIDAFWLHRQGILVARSPQKVTWKAGGMLVLELLLHNEGGRLHICDATAAGSRFPDALAQSIRLQDQARHVGGKAKLFECPQCGTLRQHLYLDHRQRFICRKCAGLTYKVQREREVDRAFRRWDKASHQLGRFSWEGWCGLKRPKGMHKRRYDELCERLRAEETIVNRSMGLLC